MSVDWPTLLAFTKVGADALSAVAWPSAALGIALLFRKAIRGVIGRANKVSVWGAEVELPALGQPTDGGSSGRILTVTPIPPHDPLLLPAEIRFREAVDEQALSVEQKLAWAIRLAAMFQMLARHEQHYRWIFGSQIAFLKQLNQLVRLTKAQAQAFWKEHAISPQPVPTYTFDNWLAFLTAEDVAVDGEGDEAVLTMTPVGKAFLVWMVQQSAPDAKPL